MKPQFSVPKRLVEDLTVVPRQEWDITPTLDFCLCELDAEAGRTEGGLVVPEKTKSEYFTRWRVLKVGPGRRAPDGSICEPQIEPGQVVMIRPELGAVIELNFTKKKTVLASEAAIFCTVAPKGEGN